MSREIKFRVWDKPNESWLELRDDGFYYHQGSGYSSLHWCLNGDEFAVMQYTGLKDKEGREIYEGDVLGAEHTPNRYTVRWDEARSGWTVDGCCGYLRGWLGSWTLPLEIIGNIHEHPSLLSPTS